MASHPYANASGCAGWMVWRRPCCRFGRYSGLGIEGKKRLRRAKYSDDAAKDSLRRKGSVLQKPASMVAEIVEGEVSGSRAQIFELEEGLTALDWGNKSSLTVEERRYIVSHCREIERRSLSILA